MVNYTTQDTAACPGTAGFAPAAPRLFVAGSIETTDAAAAEAAAAVGVARQWPFQAQALGALLAGRVLPPLQRPPPPQPLPPPHFAWQPRLHPLRRRGCSCRRPGLEHSDSDRAASTGPRASAALQRPGAPHAQRVGGAARARKRGAQMQAEARSEARGWGRRW